jgi:hypothetical protein
MFNVTTMHFQIDAVNLVQSDEAVDSATSASRNSAIEASVAFHDAGASAKDNRDTPSSLNWLWGSSTPSGYQVPNMAFAQAFTSVDYCASGFVFGILVSRGPVDPELQLWRAKLCHPISR